MEKKEKLSKDLTLKSGYNKFFETFSSDNKMKKSTQVERLIQLSEEQPWHTHKHIFTTQQHKEEMKKKSIKMKTNSFNWKSFFSFRKWFFMFFWNIFFAVLYIHFSCVRKRMKNWGWL